MATVVYREATAYEEDRRARRLSRLATVICPIWPSTTLAPTRIGLDLPCLAPSLDYSTVTLHLQCPPPPPSLAFLRVRPQNLVNHDLGCQAEVLFTHQ